MRKLNQTILVFVLFYFVEFFTSVSGFGVCLLCPEVSHIINKALNELSGTLYPFAVYGVNRNGILSGSNCLKENEKCLKVSITAENDTHGAIEECCSGVCTKASINFDSKEGEITIGTGDNEQIGTIIAFKPYEYLIYYECSDFDDDFEDATTTSKNKNADTTFNEFILIITYNLFPSKYVLNEIEGVLNYNRLKSRTLRTITNPACSDDDKDKPLVVSPTTTSSSTVASNKPIAQIDVSNRQSTVPSSASTLSKTSSSSSTVPEVKIAVESNADDLSIAPLDESIGSPLASVSPVPAANERTIPKLTTKGVSVKT